MWVYLEGTVHRRDVAVAGGQAAFQVRALLLRGFKVSRQRGDAFPVLGAAVVELRVVLVRQPASQRQLLLPGGLHVAQFGLQRRYGFRVPCQPCFQPRGAVLRVGPLRG